MARTGWGSRYGYQMDSVRRDSPGGKNALIGEIVSIVPASDTCFILRADKATPYYGGHTTTLQYFTTGVAIVQNINHVIDVIPTYTKAGRGFTTTTQLRPPMVCILNGVTTLAAIYGVNAGAASEIRCLILGKQF